MNGKVCKMCCRNLSQVGRKFGIHDQDRKVIKRCLGQKTRVKLLKSAVKYGAVSSTAMLFPADSESSATRGI